MSPFYFEARTSPWSTISAATRLHNDLRGVVLDTSPEPALPRWAIPPVAVHTQHQDHRGVVPDVFAGAAGSVLLSRRAQEDPVVGALFRSTGELLPVGEIPGTPDPDGWLMHRCTERAAVLDEERSEVQRFGSGRIMRVDTVVYRSPDDRVPAIFRLDGMETHLLFTAEARAAIDGAAIVGPEFDPALEGSRFARSPSGPTTVDELMSLPPTELDDRVWLRLTDEVEFTTPERLRAESDDVRSYLATRLFEWEIGNGGLHQYFFNHPDPELLQVVLDGYSHLGLHHVRELVEEAVAPIAAREAEWRESLRDGRIETFLDSYDGTGLEAYDHQIGFHDHVRVAMVRDRPENFSR